MRVKRPNELFKTKSDTMELYATRALAIPFANSDSAGRLSMVASAAVHTCIPIKTELPYCDSSLSQDVFSQSFANRLIQNCEIKLIDRIEFQKKICFIYSIDGVVDILEFEGFVFCQDFCYLLESDLSDMTIGETKTIGEEPFALTRLNNYDSATQSMGIGRNCVSIYSTSQTVEEDGLEIDEATAEAFTAYKFKDYQFTITDTFIKSNSDTLIPKPGEELKSEYLITLSRASKSNILIDGVIVPSGEDDAFYVKPDSYVHSVDIKTNIPQPISELGELRDEKNVYRLKVTNTLSKFTTDKLAKKAIAYKSTYKYNKYRVGPDLLKNKCIITIRVVILDKPKVGYKFTGLHGNKGTLTRIYPNGAYKDERGININIIFSTNSVIKRENYGTVKEKWINAMTLQLKYLIDNNQIPKEKVFKFTQSLMHMLGLGEDFDRQEFDVDTLYEYLKEYRLEIKLPPFSNNLNVPKMLVINNMAKQLIGHKLRTVYYNGRPMSDKHEVGDSYVLRLINDVNKGNQFSGLGETDSRGYLMEDDSSAKDGKSMHTKKSAKMSDIALNIEIQKLPPLVSHKLLNTTPNYALNELANACGYGFGFTSEKDMKAQKSLTGYLDEEEDEEDEFLFDEEEDDDIEWQY
ncbi:MAG: hypothetical protein ACRCX2_38940 [Paraclostridium sp.]